MKKGLKVTLFIILFVILGFIAVYFIYGCSNVNYRFDSLDLVYDSLFYSAGRVDYISFTSDISDTVIYCDGVFYSVDSYSFSEGVFQFLSGEDKLDFVFCDEDTLFSSSFKEYFYREV